MQVSEKFLRLLPLPPDMLTLAPMSRSQIQLCTIT